MTPSKHQCNGATGPDCGMQPVLLLKVEMEPWPGNLCKTCQIMVKHTDV